MFHNLQQLVTTFSRDICLARDLASANAEDDLVIKAAIVGFSYHSPIAEWAKGHFDFVRSRIDRDYGPQELAEYGVDGENVKLFFALSIGFLVGLYQRGDINDQEFRIAEHQIPGILMLHLSELTEARIDGL